MRATDGVSRTLSGGLVIAALIFLLTPVVIVVILSFSNTSFLFFPPQGWGLRQYETLFASTKWLSAIRLSIEVGLLSSLFALLIGVPAVFGLYRARAPMRGTIRSLGLSGLIIPVSAYAVALFGLFAQLNLLGTLKGLVIAHALLSIPLVLITVGSAIDRISPDLELAAMSLGASRSRAWVGVTLRLLLPAVLAAFILCLVTSFDEAVFVNFLGGPGLATLPKEVFDSVRFGTDAVITAIATLLIFATGALVAAAMTLSRKSL
jgi:ABC-type spermidine/putrescine transport system permease subunit II